MDSPHGRLRLQERLSDRRGKPPLASSATVGLTWIFAYHWWLILLAYWLDLLFQMKEFEFLFFQLYLELWFGDHGNLLTLQQSVMTLNVLMAVYLWQQFRLLRHNRRMQRGSYVLLAGATLLLLVQQLHFAQLSDIDSPRLMRFPPTLAGAIPDPTPDAPEPIRPLSRE